MTKLFRRTRERMPRRLTFTREGRVFIVVTLGVGAAAVNTGNNLLYLVLGMMLSLIVLSGILSEAVLRQLRIERRLPRRAFALSPCLIELAVTNGKARVPSYSIELEDLVEGESTERRCYFLKVDAGEEQSASYPRTPSRRGRLRFRAIEVRTRYPFGLFEKSRTIELEEELVVYPALLPDRSAAALDLLAGPEVPTPRLGVGGDLAGLRDLRDGDEARSIHWRRSASLGRTVVRERHRDAARRISLYLDTNRPRDATEAWDEKFEHEVRHAATVAGRAVEEGAAVEIVTAADRSPWILPGRPPDPAWHFLALTEATDPESGEAAS